MAVPACAIKHISHTFPCSELSKLEGVLVCWRHRAHISALLRRRFLNRMLGMPVARQALLFGYFAATLAAEIQSAKAEGRYFEGVSDLSGSNISRAEDPQACHSSSPALLGPHPAAYCRTTVASQRHAQS